MTERDDTRGQVPDADPLDELASAILDGEASAAELARAVEPEVAERVARFAVVADAVAGPVPPVAEASRDAAIDAALAAWRAGDGVEGGRGRDELTARRQRTARLTRTLRIAGAAAAVVAVVALGAVVLDGGSPSTEDAATSAADSEEAGGEAVPDAASESIEGGSAADDGADAGAYEVVPSSPTAFTSDLGTFESAGALLDEAAERRGAAMREQGSSNVDSTVLALEALECSAPDLAGTIEAATATLDGRRVVVFTADQPDGEIAVVVLDAVTCDEIARRTP